MQVALRAPGRGYTTVSVGTPEGGDPVSYPVSDTGVAVVHSSHVAAAKSLGFKLCSEENPEAPPVAAYSAEDFRAMKEFKKLMAATESDAKAKADAEVADKAKSDQASKTAAAALQSKLDADVKAEADALAAEKAKAAAASSKK